MVHVRLIWWGEAPERPTPFSEPMVLYLIRAGLGQCVYRAGLCGSEEFKGSAHGLAFGDRGALPRLRGSG
jgi:hypothetical protein